MEKIETYYSNTNHVESTNLDMDIRGKVYLMEKNPPEYLDLSTIFMFWSEKKRKSNKWLRISTQKQLFIRCAQCTLMCILNKIYQMTHNAVVSQHTLCNGNSTAKTVFASVFFWFCFCLNLHKPIHSTFLCHSFRMRVCLLFFPWFFANSQMKCIKNANNKQKKCKKNNQNLCKFGI